MKGVDRDDGIRRRGFSTSHKTSPKVSSSLLWQKRSNDAIQDGVVMLEMSFDIRLAEFYSGGLTELCAFIEALVERYRTQANLRPELGFSRGNADDPKLMALAQEALEMGVFQIN